MQLSVFIITVTVVTLANVLGCVWPCLSFLCVRVQSCGCSRVMDLADFLASCLSQQTYYTFSILTLSTFKSEKEAFTLIENPADTIMYTNAHIEF